MADFFQNGVIATLHDLGRRPTADLEQELKAWSADQPMSLVIPCLIPIWTARHCNASSIS
ncbi:MAG: hypothetical protein CM1200mP26_21420 [Acidimicrobiales bacterium]|nr:MAG: hypothetical protein CM1200mP26_21420 [Acidimicrobiales bacterium]